MLVTLFGIVIEVKPSHPLKAEVPMLVTLFGIVIVVKPSHPLKAPQPIFEMVLGIIVVEQPAINVLDAVSIIALQLLRES